ncbi:hypothetical protein [Winogradskyella sp.]
MAINQKIYDNRKILRLISVLMMFLGVIIAYFCYDSEPWETIGGFLCGAGFAFLIIFVSLKEPKNHS